MQKTRMKAIQRIKKELELLAYRSPDQKLTDDDIKYLCGIADCLEIINRIESQTLKVGTNYYVLIWDDSKLSIVIDKRKLEKIVETAKGVFYVFSPSKKYHDRLTLSGRGLYDRVYHTFADARSNVSDVYIDKTQRFDYD